MTRYFLGVDIGGTKSHALIADERGNALGFGAGGAGNYESVGLEGYVETLRGITGKALESAGLTLQQISGAGFGIAGYDWPVELPLISGPIHNLGLECPIAIVNDTIIGLYAGSSSGWGVVIVAGTSNNCRGLDKNGREGRVTGNGPYFGEFGGAGELIWKATIAVSHAWTRLGAETALTDTFLKHTGAEDVVDMLVGLQHQRYNLDAKDAPLVFELARNGDRVAQDTITWSGKELGKLAIGVIRQLNFEDIPFEIVLVGSMFKGKDLLLDPLQRTVKSVAPYAKFNLLQAPPVVGGVILGIQKAGFPWKNILATLRNSTKALLKHEITA